MCGEHSCAPVLLTPQRLLICSSNCPHACSRTVHLCSTSCKASSGETVQPRTPLHTLNTLISSLPLPSNGMGLTTSLPTGRLFFELLLIGMATRVESSGEH